MSVSSLHISTLRHFPVSWKDHAYPIYSSLVGTDSINVDDEPKFPVHVNDAAFTFVKTHRFGLYTNDSDWDFILPDGEGFLYLPSRDEHYFVAHYHQMHCLRALRNYFLDVHKMNKLDYGHVSHCLMYLREAALCNVDLTLEPASHKQHKLSGHLGLAVTGFGVTHRCRDWSQVHDYMTLNYKEHEESYERKAAEFYQSLENDSGQSSTTKG